MRKISEWARRNPNKSRVIITISHFILLFGAIALGLLFVMLDLGYAPLSLLLIGSLFFIAYFFYPIRTKKTGIYKHSYVRQKTHDFLLLVSYPLVIALGLNNLVTTTSLYDVNYGEPTAQLMVYKYSPEKDLNKEANPFAKVRAKTKIFKKYIRAQLRLLKKELKDRAKEDRNGLARFFGVVLILAAAIALGLLVAALSCNISCSGQEGLAGLVLLLGWGAIIFLAVIGIRAVLRKKRIKVQQP